MKAILTSELFVVVAENDQTEIHDSLVVSNGKFMIFTSREAAEQVLETIKLDLLEKRWVVITFQEYMSEVLDQAYLLGCENDCCGGGFL